MDIAKLFRTAANAATQVAKKIATFRTAALLTTIAAPLALGGCGYTMEFFPHQKGTSYFDYNSQWPSCALPGQDCAHTGAVNIPNFGLRPPNSRFYAPLHTPQYVEPQQN